MKAPELLIDTMGKSTENTRSGKISARALTDGGVAAGRYRCMVDIGWAQAWRRL
ncbi:MAG TPA: hypothetical protein PK916_04500 [Bacteroidota bacterium]|nr:hypothetical protein [Bacteroidota bacterium]